MGWAAGDVEFSHAIALLSICWLAWISIVSILVVLDDWFGQRIIDKHMGHQTEEMRKRYQHLMPEVCKRAVEVLVD